MKLVALALVGALLPLAAPGPASAPTAHASDLPAGCEAADGRYVCTFYWNTTDAQPDSPAGTAVSLRDFNIPLFAFSTLDVRTHFEGDDNGWVVILWRSDGQGNALTYDEVSRSQHPAAGRTGVVETVPSSFVAHADANRTTYFRIRGTEEVLGGSGFFRDPSSNVPSRGTFRVRIVVSPVPEGVAPARPAATREHPQVTGAALDTARADLDVTSAWLTDVRLGDGLMDAHVGVRSLANESTLQAYAGWGMDFAVRGQSYHLQYDTSPGNNGRAGYCALDQAGALDRRTVANPECRVDEANATVDFVFPESSVGSPGESDLFDGIGAESYSCDAAGACGQEDAATTQHFTFALGGPAVWDKLNGCVFCAPKVAWYRDPLAPENIPNTLQVLGALVAAVSFVGGLVIVRRNRKHTKELLARVDSLVERSAADAGALMLALAELEQDFTRLYHAGKINDAQYQVAVQRVVAAASRLSLRRELETERTVRVPVSSAEAPPRAMNEREL